MPSGGRRGDTIRTSAALAAAAALLIGLGAVAAHALAARGGIDITTPTQADVERFVAAWGAWSALGSVALMVLHSFLPLPAEIIPLVNGMMFGPWLGIALTWIGAMLGAVLSFALARGLGRPFVRLVVSEARSQQIAAIPVRPCALLLVDLPVDHRNRHPAAHRGDGAGRRTDPGGARVGLGARRARPAGALVLMAPVAGSVMAAV